MPRPKKVEKLPEVEIEKPVEVTEVVEETPELKVEQVKVEMPTYENTKVVKVLVENDPVQSGHHLCKMENGTTMHVPTHLFR